jgi:hypothetical protein
MIMSSEIGRGACLLLLCLATPVWADDGSVICPDRPGKGTSACTVDAGRWQLELGLYDGSFQRRAGTTTDTTSAGAALLKYGVSDSFDIEAGMALYQSVRVHDAGGTQTQDGIGDLYLHGKWNPGGGALAIVLDPYIKLPTAGGGLSNGAVEGGLVVPLSYDLGGGWSLAATPEADLLRDGAGGGYHWNAVTVVGLGRSFDDGLSLGAEVWTAQNFDPSGNSHQYSFDLDAAWLAGKDTQLDAGINAGLNRATPDLEIYAGVSRRF